MNVSARSIPILAAAIAVTATSMQAQQRSLDERTAGRFADLALACVQKEYPNKIAHVLNSPEDVKAPRAKPNSLPGSR